MTLYFRGKPACECQGKFLPVFEREAQDLGIIDGPLPLSQIIGGAKRSAGAHTTGGADDTYPLTRIKDVDAYVRLSRDMGADATWERPEDWDGAGGVAHVHRCLTNCPHLAPVAANQVTAVRAGFNGLGHLGRGGPDTGPRPLSGRTWQEGVAWAKKRQRVRSIDAKIAGARAEIAALNDTIAAARDDKAKLQGKVADWIKTRESL